MKMFGNFVIGALVATIVLGPPAWANAYRAVDAGLTVASLVIGGHHSAGAASAPQAPSASVSLSGGLRN